MEAELERSQERIVNAADGQGRVTISGRICACTTVSSGIQYTLDRLSIVKNVKEDRPEQRLKEDHRILVTLPEELPWGGSLMVQGAAESFERAGNPGQFDAREYYYLHDTVCRLLDAKVQSVRPGGHGLRALLWKLRRALDVSYVRILGEKDAQTISAVSLGEKAWMDREVKALYQESGIAHIASVSGLHISLLGMGLYRLLRGLPVGIGCSAAVSGSVLTLYVLLTGGSMSAVRAWLMFLLWLLAKLTGRKYDAKTAVAAAAILLLAGEPRYLKDASFWLSFSAVAVIAFLLPELTGAFCTEEGHGARFLTPLVSSAGIWFGMLPVTLYFFYQTPPWSMLLNLVIVPLMPILMGMGLVSGFAGLVSTGLGMFLAAPVHYLLQLFDLLCRVGQRLPGAVWVLGRPSVPAMILYYALMCVTAAASVRVRGRARSAGLVRRIRPAEPTGCVRVATRCSDGSGGKTRAAGHGGGGRQLRILWGLCICACLCLIQRTPPRQLEVLCLDVGQGDGALVRTPSGAVFLIDGGSSTERALWTYRIGQTLKYYGIDTIDAVFLSHADGDHTSGVQEYLEEYETGFLGENVHGITLRRLVLSPTADPADFAGLAAAAAQKGIPVSRMEQGGVFGCRKAGRRRGEAWCLTCLAPDGAALTGDKNEDSMVLLLQYGSFRMLFTGDLEGEAEQKLASSNRLPECDVLKVGHHGSKNGTSASFLARVQPAAAVVSCGARNRYGHPSKETLSRLADAGVRTYSTAESGAVQICTDGEQEVTVKVSESAKHRAIDFDA